MPLRLPGINEFGKVTSPPFLADNTGTVIFWLNAAVLEFAFLVGITTDGQTDDEIMLFMNSSSGDLVFSYTDGGLGQFQATTPTGLLTAGVDHLVALTSDGSTVKVYVDAVLTTLTPTLGSNTGQWFQDAANADIFIIGALVRAATILFSNATFREVAVYDTDLSLTQITNIYNEKTSGSYDQILTANQQSYYPLNDGEDGANASSDIFEDVWGGVDGAISGTTPLWKADDLLSDPGNPIFMRSVFVPVLVPTAALLRLNLSSDLTKTLARNSKVTKVKKHTSKLAKTLLLNSTRN